MIFALEALEAKHGDALLLHGGSDDAPVLVVIDGGPSGVYNASLRPRLEQLRAARAPDAPLNIDLLMVSHIDDDHIRGVLDLTDKLVQAKGDGKSLPYRIEAFWYNSFDDILGNDGGGASAQSAALNEIVTVTDADPGDVKPLPALFPGENVDSKEKRPALAVAASVAQGRRVRDNAAALGLSVNAGFNGLVMRPTEGNAVRQWGELKLTILGPAQERVTALQEEWDTQIKKAGVAKTAEFVDDSVYNLSSIIVLAECAGRRMLLTGDGRGDDILAGLEAAGVLQNGMVHLDLLKLPHHGSDRDVSLDFFRQVTADYYVVSGNGKYGNPEIETLQMISEARGGEEFTLCLTNSEPYLTKFFAQEKAQGKNYRVVFREPNALSVRVDLGSAAPAS